MDTQKMIPHVLLDFLYDLIHADRAIYEIKLVSNVLGVGEVQDIICKTIKGSVFHRVFGFSPVNAKLRVFCRAGKQELQVLCIV